MAFAGLWEVSHAEDGERIESCAIVTAPANGLMAEIHNTRKRMPVVRNCWNRYPLNRPSATSQRKPAHRPGRVAAWRLGARPDSIAACIASQHLPVRFTIMHAVYMHRHLVSVRPLDELTDKQRRFLGGVAAKIPRLLEAIEAGGSSARFKLGTRRLEDGRRVELELVARVPRRKWHGIANSWGQMLPRSSVDDEA